MGPAEVGAVSPLARWRRLDWQFLLPDLVRGPVVHSSRVGPDLLACLPLLGPEVRELPASGGLARPAGSAHVAVLANPTQDEVRTAVRALRPDGVLYAEVVRRRPGRRGGGAGLPRTWWLLRSAGLRDVRLHWHAPDFAGTARIVPLSRDARPVVHGSLLRYSAVRFGWAKSLLGRLALRLGVFPLGVTYGSVTGTRRTFTDAPHAGYVEQVLRRHVTGDVLRAHGLQEAMTVVLVTPRYPTSRHVVGLVHPRGGPSPVLVVKVPRRPHDDSGVRREADILGRVTDAVPGVGAVAPDVLGLFAERDRLVLVETAMHGIPLDPEQVRADPDRAVAAGLDLVSRLPAEPTPVDGGGEVFRRVIGAALDRFQDRLPGVPDISALVARTRVALGRLEAAGFPVVLEHADLSHPNLFLHDDGTLGAIDWERATEDGLPGHDLVFYLQYVAESQAGAYDREAQVAVFEQVFLASSGWGRRLLGEHLVLRGVDPGLTPDVLLASWVKSATTLVDRLLPEDGDETRVGISGEDLTATVLQDRDTALWRRALEHLERERERPVVDAAGAE